MGFVRSLGKTLPNDQITLNAICPGIVKTNISSGDFYKDVEEKGLLVKHSSLVDAFESLLGGSGTSGEAVEVLPGNPEYQTKECPPYTNDRCKENVEIAREFSQRST